MHRGWRSMSHACMHLCIVAILHVVHVCEPSEHNPISPRV